MSIGNSDFETRLTNLTVILACGFGLLLARLFYLQVVRGETLRTIAESNRTSLISERAPRGLILDRDGRVLADRRPTFVVLFTPLDVEREVLDKAKMKLSSILGFTPEELAEKLRPALKRASLVRLADRVSRPVAFALAEQLPSLPGITVANEMQRRYPNGNLACHALGYLGQISRREYERLRAQGYQPDWLIGKAGLEKVFDNVLRGEYGGMRMEVDAAGRSIKIIDRKEPLAGYQVRTTLDLDIQSAAEAGLAGAGKAGAVVALDPRNGDILAFASAPGYDPNAFVHVRGEELEDEESVGKIVNRPDLPLFNRAIQGLYAPGSVFKIVDAAAALESRRIPPEESYFCPGYFWLGGPGGKKFLCWKKEGHGRMGLKDGLIHSCNVYFYNMSLKLGPDPIESLAGKFGLGRPTGVGIPGEKAGFVPGRKMFTDGRRRWFDGDTLNMAIGQGTVLFSPMQAAQLAAAVASRGKIYRPNFLKDIRNPSGELVQRGVPELLGQVRMSPDTWDFLDAALIEVVERGTAQSCRIPGVRVAGKTGTAQNPHGDDHAWFVAYAPAGDPVIAVCVLVEHGKHGSSAAAPIARKVLLAALGSPESPAPGAAPLSAGSGEEQE